MSKTTKVVMVVGLIFAGLTASCLLCLATSALTDQTPAASASGSTLDGRYGCFQSRGVQGPNGQLTPRWTAVPVPNFRINGTKWSDANTDGSVTVAGEIITFTGGSLEGWRGRIGADSKPFIAFGEKHDEVNEGTGNRWNDFKCYVQPD